MKMPEPYRKADQCLKNLTLLILQRSNKVKRNLNSLNFDELNVMKMIDVLYEQIERDCRQAFMTLYEGRYDELLAWLKGEEPDEDKLDELVEMYFAGLFDEPHPVTNYAFDPETKRKRDRAKEAILSVPTKAQKQITMDKHIRFQLQQIGWYVDFVSQDAEIQVYKDAGIKKVQRHEMMDDRTCTTCSQLDGKVYDINKIPPLEHLRCRRWFSPYNK